jgi:hypothetical protein
MNFKISEPKCEDMVQWLIKNDGYEGKTRQELLEDRMLKIVASSCNMDIESVANLVETLLKQRKSK